MQNLNPDKILAISDSYWQACILHAAVKLDIFTIIGESAISVEKLANVINADVEGLTRLTNALTAMKFLHKRDDIFLNSDMSKKYLNKNSEFYLGFIILHHHYMTESWTKLDKAVLSGRRVRTGESFNEKRREAFLMGMYNLAMMTAPDLVKRLELNGCKSLLDLGGGPGTYAIHFCLQNPGLEAVVFDLPETRPFALKTIEKFGLSDKISFMEGDFTKDELKGTYDVVWMSHILHCEGSGICREMMQKAVNALAPGGLIMIHDFILSDTKDAPLYPTIFSIHMLLGRGEGKSYCIGELEQMLKDAGISDIRRASFKGPNDSGVIIGKKSASIA